MSNGLTRLSLNTATTKRWSLEEAVHGCVDKGIPAIGPWRDRVAEVGVERAAKLIKGAGLHVSSLCRGGFLTAATAEQRDTALADNRRAIDEAATLDADTLVLVVGGLPDGSRNLAAARTMVVEALGELVPYAAERGVQLSIEPLHPLYCADRAVVSTLRQALDIAEAFSPEQVGVVVDTFHIWWDPEVIDQIRRAGQGGRIASYQVCDWMVPLPADVLLGRGHMGDGVIDFTPLNQAVDAAGYKGYIEVEIFNADVWAAPGQETLATMIERYRTHIPEQA